MKEGQKFEPICTKCMILAITYSSHWDLWELVAINMQLFGYGITPWLLSLLKTYWIAKSKTTHESCTVNPTRGRQAECWIDMYNLSEEFWILRSNMF